MIAIKRGLNTILSVRPYESSQLRQELMSDDKITLEWKQTSYINLAIGDYIMFSLLPEGEDEVKYRLNALPRVKKVASNKWEYTAVFESSMYDLAKAQYLLFDGTDTVPQGEFPLTGKAPAFVQLLVDNLNRVAGSALWSVGDVVSGTSYKTLSFQNEDCLSVIRRLAEEFNTEFRVEGNVVHLDKYTSQNDMLTLEYGSTLYDIERVSVDSSKIITRLYAFGGTENLAADYRGGSTRLLMPGKTYIESANKNIYGLIEGTETWEEVYPHYTGAVTMTYRISSDSIHDERWVIVDGNMNFEPWDYQVSTPMRIAFLTGALAGYEFPIEGRMLGYGPATRYYFYPIREANGYAVPSVGGLQPAVDDQFTIINITQPAEYIPNAEAELEALATAYLAEHDRPRVEYRVTFSDIFAKQHPDLNLSVGDKIKLKDTQLGVNDYIRVSAITRGVDGNVKLEITLADTPARSAINSFKDSLLNLGNKTFKTDREVSRRGLESQLAVAKTDIKATEALTGLEAKLDTSVFNTEKGTLNASIAEKASTAELAATDTKASMALSSATSANTKIDELEVGGRNYIQLKKLISVYSTTPVVTGRIISTTKTDTGDITYIALAVSGYTPTHGTYTQSGIIKLNGNPMPASMVPAVLSSWNQQPLISKSYDETTGRLVCTQILNGIFMYFIHAPFNGIVVGDVVTFENWKLESGNRATDWTPAPEDVDANIAAKLDTTVFNAEKATINGSIAERATIAALNSGLEGKASTGALAITDTKASMALNTATSANTKIDELEVGGRNLKVNSTEISDFWILWNMQGAKSTISDDSIASGKVGVFDITVNINNNGGFFTNIKNVNLVNELNQDYTVSFYMKGSKDLPLTSTINNIQTINKNIPSVTTEYQKYWYTFRLSTLTAPNHNFHLFFQGTAPFILYIHSFKVEKGNKPTDWTPAPEDVDANMGAKLDTSTFNTFKAGNDAALAEKATIAALNSGLAGKASNAALTATDTKASSALTQAASAINYASNSLDIANNALYLAKPKLLRPFDGEGLRGYYLGGEKLIWDDVIYSPYGPDLEFLWTSFEKMRLELVFIEDFNFPEREVLVSSAEFDLSKVAVIDNPIDDHHRLSVGRLSVSGIYIDPVGESYPISASILFVEMAENYIITPNYDQVGLKIYLTPREGSDIIVYDYDQNNPRSRLIL